MTKMHDATMSSVNETNIHSILKFSAEKLIAGKLDEAFALQNQLLRDYEDRNATYQIHSVPELKPIPGLWNTTNKTGEMLILEKSKLELSIGDNLFYAGEHEAAYTYYQSALKNIKKPEYVEKAEVSRVLAKCYQKLGKCSLFFSREQGNKTSAYQEALHYYEDATSSLAVALLKREGSEQAQQNDAKEIKNLKAVCITIKTKLLQNETDRGPIIDVIKKYEEWVDIYYRNQQIPKLHLDKIIQLYIKLFETNLNANDEIVAKFKFFKRYSLFLTALLEEHHHAKVVSNFVKQYHKSHFKQINKTLIPLIQTHDILTAASICEMIHPMIELPTDYNKDYFANWLLVLNMLCQDKAYMGEQYDTRTLTNIKEKLKNALEFFTTSFTDTEIEESHLELLENTILAIDEITTERRNAKMAKEIAKENDETGNAPFITMNQVINVEPEPIVVPVEKAAIETATIEAVAEKETNDEIISVIEASAETVAETEIETETETETETESEIENAPVVEISLVEEALPVREAIQNQEASPVVEEEPTLEARPIKVVTMPVDSFDPRKVLQTKMLKGNRYEQYTAVWIGQRDEQFQIMSKVLLDTTTNIEEIDESAITNFIHYAFQPKRFKITSVSKEDIELAEKLSHEFLEKHNSTHSSFTYKYQSLVAAGDHWRDAKLYDTAINFYQQAQPHEPTELDYSERAATKIRLCEYHLSEINTAEQIISETSETEEKEDEITIDMVIEDEKPLIALPKQLLQQLPSKLNNIDEEVDAALEYTADLFIPNGKYSSHANDTTIIGWSDEVKTRVADKLFEKRDNHSKLTAFAILEIGKQHDSERCQQKLLSAHIDNGFKKVQLCDERLSDENKSNSIKVSLVNPLIKAAALHLNEAKKLHAHFKQTDASKMSWLQALADKTESLERDISRLRPRISRVADTNNVPTFFKRRKTPTSVKNISVYNKPKERNTFFSNAQQRKRLRDGLSPQIVPIKKDWGACVERNAPSTGLRV